ncbi:MAG: ABC transporter ATP-binding protein [Spirochaetaceae bacterium]|nr:ABC transporter ATP-binding protein [Spirochaetaceae bacterium]
MSWWSLMGSGRLSKGDRTARFRQLLPFILRMTRAYRSTFLNMGLCVFGGSVMLAALPYLFALVVDEVIYHRDLELVPYLGILFGLLLIGGQLLFAIEMGCWSLLKTDFHTLLRLHTFEHVTHLEPRILDGIETSDVVTTINNDIAAFTNFAHHGMAIGVANVVQFVLSVAIVATIDPIAAGILVVCGILTYVATRNTGRLVHARYGRMREGYGHYVSWLYEVITGRREIRRLGAQDTVTKWFLHRHNGMLRNLVRAWWAELAGERAVELVVVAATIAMYGWAATLVVVQSMTLGTFLALIEYLTLGRIALSLIGRLNVWVQSFYVRMGRLQQMLARSREVAGPVAAATRTAGSDVPEPGPAAPPIAPSWERIRSLSEGMPPVPVLHTAGGRRSFQFDAVRFRYSTEAATVLDGLDLSAEPGERISLVGRSGVGKTSLIQLLLRFYRPQSGQVSILGRALDEYSLEQIRQMVGVVYQDPILFPDTVRRNLSPPWFAGSDADLESALDAVGMSAWLSRQSSGLDTVVEQRATFSRGERQRLAIARMRLREPHVIIMDEATSGVDDARESHIYAALSGRLPDRTLLIVTHRLATSRRADRVVVLDDGRIVADGSHDHVRATSAVYRNLMTEQRNGHGGP